MPTAPSAPLISAVPAGIKVVLPEPDPAPSVAPPAPPVEPVAPVAPPAPPVAPVAPSHADDADFFVDFDAEEGPAVEQAPSVVPDADADDDADDDDDVEATRLAAPRVASLVLRWDDGTVTVVTRPTVIGRGPVGGEGDEVEAIADPTLSLSKSHARFVAAPEASVTDLHSTNGMLVERAGAPLAAPPGVPIPLSHGDAVVFGKRRLIVEVTR